MKRAHGQRRARLLALPVLVAVAGFALGRLDQPELRATGTSAQDPVAQPAGGMPVTELDRRFREAVLMLHAHDYDHALTALQRVLELSPRLPEAHANTGFALLGLERYAAARDFFQVAIALRPQQVNAYWGLAASLEALCDLAGARGAMRSYVHLTDASDPFLPKARAALWEWDAHEARAAGGCQPAVPHQ